MSMCIIYMYIHIYTSLCLHICMCIYIYLFIYTYIRIMVSALTEDSEKLNGTMVCVCARACVLYAALGRLAFRPLQTPRPISVGVFGDSDNGDVCVLARCHA